MTPRFETVSRLLTSGTVTRRSRAVVAGIDHIVIPEIIVET
jgi:hypothetical protein